MAQTINLPRDSTLRRTNEILTNIAAAMGGVVDTKDWMTIRNIVRAGNGAKNFPVGYEFSVHNSDYEYDMIFRVVAHDHHKAADSHLEHTMTLEMKNVLSNSSGSYIGMQFDAPEALYYAKDGLAAGTYNFAWEYSSGSIVSGTYEFILTRAVPAGGQIVLGTNGNSHSITDCKIYTYASVGADEPIESNIVVTNGSEGKNLGTVSATAATDEKLNCATRVIYGSNNYAQSAIDQWIESSSESGAVWKAQTVFDRPPSWADTRSGYMHGLPEDFLAAVQPAIIPCSTNSVFETDSLDGTKFAIGHAYNLEREFFLLSRAEIFGSGNDGEILEYYDGLTDAERIHRDEVGTARKTRLRSPHLDYANGIYIISNSGKASNFYPSDSDGVAVACIIA